MARFLRYVFVICFCICLPFLTALVFLRCSLAKQPADDKPPELIKAASSQMTVPFIAQNPDFPTGCEAVSAVMALRYYGECVTVDDFVDNFLSCSDAFYTMNGVSYGPDPHQFFIGDPRTKTATAATLPSSSRRSIVTPEHPAVCETRPGAVWNICVKSISITGILS